MNDVRTEARDVDVVIVGAGFAGLGLGIRLSRADYGSYVILERGDDVGGTWRDNHYPGVACDVPSHLYCYSFRPNPHWSQFFAPGGEIQQYLRESVHAEGIGPHIRLGVEMTSARWDETQRRWLVSTTGGGYRARALVLAAGRLSEPCHPEVPGLDTFPGPLFHTSRWDHDAALDGRAVGVVGTGASAAQVVPQLARRSARLVVFQRSPPYVVPRENRQYSARERRRFAANPKVLRELRDRLFTEAEHAVAQRHGVRPDIDQVRDRALGHLARQVPDPGLRRRLRPNYEIGCKRILLSDDYYPALTRSNVVLEQAPLVAVDGHTVTASNGARYPLDVLVLATGFLSTRPPFARRVRGRGNTLLADHWRHGMVSYASTTVHGFPNMFVLDGPNASLGHNSAIHMIETQIGYVLGALDHLRHEGVGALEVSADAERAYTHWIDAMSRETVWLGCHSWYRDSKTGRLTLLWPDSATAFRKQNGTFDPEPYLRHH